MSRPHLLRQLGGCQIKFAWLIKRWSQMVPPKARAPTTMCMSVSCVSPENKERLHNLRDQKNFTSRIGTSDQRCFGEPCRQCIARSSSQGWWAKRRSFARVSRGTRRWPTAFPLRRQIVQKHALQACEKNSASTTRHN